MLETFRDDEGCVLADETSRQVRGALSGPLEALYTSLA